MSEINNVESLSLGSLNFLRAEIDDYLFRINDDKLAIVSRSATTQILLYAHSYHGFVIPHNSAVTEIGDVWGALRYVITFVK
tara:strand:- start:371 stop:616 length:246 start_codon:yes stop_codon:yes gene_type:complete